MKTYKEMAEEVFRTGDERIEAQKEKRKKYTALISAAAVAAVAIVLWQVGASDGKTPKPQNEAVTGTEETAEINSESSTTKKDDKAAQNAYTTAPYRDESTGTSDAVPEDGGEEFYGGESGFFSIPCFPRRDGIEYSGEKITDEEAKEYFSKNTWLVSALSSSGVETDNIKISERGYSHISFYGREDEQLLMKLDFRDYLVYSGDKLVSIVTLVKENGEISATPAFGAAWFEDYGKFLNAHKGEKLVFAYAGSCEFVVTPDGEVADFLGGNLKSYFGGIPNIYEKLYCPEAVYVP